RAVQGLKGILTAYQSAGSGRGDPTPAAWSALVGQLHTLVASSPEAQQMAPGLLPEVSRWANMGNYVGKAADVRELGKLASTLASANRTAYDQDLDTYLGQYRRTTGRPDSDIYLPPIAWPDFSALTGTTARPMWRPPSRAPSGAIR